MSNSTQLASDAASNITDIQLRDKDGNELKAGELWSEQPIVLLVLRRPGCLLCRNNAIELYNAIHEDCEKNGVKMVAVCHEWIKPEIEAFTPEFWPAEVYLDVNKDFFKLMGGGKLLRANLLSMLNPFGAVWRRIRAAGKNVKKHNLIGDGTILGGVLVISNGDDKAGKVHYLHVEADLGVAADHAEVLKAAHEAACAK